ncbi:MAG: single-stranded DNA-binding protein [Sphaerochaetaceae bacterium]
MNNLNSILIEGNLTRDPNLTVLDSGRNVCNFAIATNYYYRNKEKDLVNEVTYINVDAWGALAENCSKYLRKGRGVRVVGRLKQERWNDDDGERKERFTIVAEHVEFQGDPAWKEGPAVSEEVTQDE